MYNKDLGNIFLGPSIDIYIKTINKLTAIISIYILLTFKIKQLKNYLILPQIQSIRRFDFSGHILFVIHLDVHYF